MKYLVCLFFVGTLLACKDKSDFHLPPKEMQKILLDVHTAEVYSSLVKKDSLHLQDNRNMDSLSRYYKEIFAHYHITKEQFDQSLNWYRDNPEELDSVYALMIPRLNTLQADPSFRLK